MGQIGMGYSRRELSFSHGCGARGVGAKEALGNRSFAASRCNYMYLDKTMDMTKVVVA